MRQREQLELDAQQAASDKAQAQQALLASAQAHAALQRKVADTTRAMADAKQQLLELEMQRAQQQERELAALRVSLQQQHQHGEFASALASARAKAEQASLDDGTAQPGHAGAAGVWRAR